MMAEQLKQPEVKERLRISSKGKRLFALLWDFVFILLFLNTLDQALQPEHWDLQQKEREWSDGGLWFYSGMCLYFVLKDCWNGRSLGKVLLGMRIRSLADLKKDISPIKAICRNLCLFLFPIEAVSLLKDGYARRLGDRWCKTVVIDQLETLRPIMRLFLGNFILFGFFVAATALQNPNIVKTALYQTGRPALEAHPPVQKLLEKGVVLEKPEIRLDFRNQQEPSLLRMRMEDGDTVYLFDVSLQYKETPSIHWEVLNITQGNHDQSM